MKHGKPPELLGAVCARLGFLFPVDSPRSGEDHEEDEGSRGRHRGQDDDHVQGANRARAEDHTQGGAEHGDVGVARGAHSQNPQDDTRRRGVDPRLVVVRLLERARAAWGDAAHGDTEVATGSVAAAETSAARPALLSQSYSESAHETGSPSCSHAAFDQASIRAACSPRGEYRPFSQCAIAPDVQRSAVARRSRLRPIASRSVFRRVLALIFAPRFFKRASASGAASGLVRAIEPIT